jgi:hypothetical protein
MQGVADLAAETAFVWPTDEQRKTDMTVCWGHGELGAQNYGNDGRYRA